MAKPPPIGIGTVTAPPVYRQGPATPPPPATFAITSANISAAWGSEAGAATIVYDYAGTPATTGWLISLAIAGHNFNGICLNDQPVQSSGGNKRTLTFKDYRYWLEFDDVYCSFNKLDDHIVNGVRLKRYVHYLPDLGTSVNINAWTGNQASDYGPGQFFSTLTKTYTSSPLTAAQIINIIMGSDSVNDVWGLSFHADQINLPVYEIDASGGKKLKAILTEIADQQGLVMGLFPNQPLGLCWVRKGTDDERFPNAFSSLVPPLDAHPLTGQVQNLTDDRVYGTSLSANPSQIQILGDRNLYQVHNITMTKDWSPGWEAFYDVILFREDIYQRGAITSDTTIKGHKFPKGTLFKDIGSSQFDTDQIISRQLALVMSLEITVAQYASLRGEKLFIDTPNFADYRKFCGRSRLDVPAVLYIEQILFRAFRFPNNPDGSFFSIRNTDGNNVPLDSMNIADKLIARVTHDPTSGVMTWDATQSADGNGYAIVQGYQVGRDLFRTINPDRFDLNSWNTANKLWEHIEFKMDDTGEPDGKYILFDSPVIASGSLVSITDGLGHFNAHPTKANGKAGFDIPPVQIACCFQAERYHYLAGLPGRLETYQIGGLNREIAMAYGNSPNAVEIVYADMATADEKAIQYIAPLNLLEYIYKIGGYRRPLIPNAAGKYSTGINLNPYLDRVSVGMTIRGPIETIEYTTERPRSSYTPERDFDRNTKLLTLLPGQAQLRGEINVAKILARSLQINPKVTRTLSAAFRELFGSAEPTSEVPVLSTNTPATSATLPVGTPLWQKPTDTSSGSNANTTAVPPGDTTAQHSVFAGTTTRDGEVCGAGQTVITQSTGFVLARVMGPCQSGASVGQVAGQNYLSASSTIFVGTARQSISTPTVQLIPVQIGTGQPAISSFPFQLIKVTESSVMVSAQSALLLGDDCKTLVPIGGLGFPMSVVVDNTVFYLEVLFDINGNPIAANIASDVAGWRTPLDPGWVTGMTKNGFPKLVAAVDNNFITAETALLHSASQLWADNLGGLKIAATAATALAQFTGARARFNQFYAYALIGFATTAPGASGITLAGGLVINGQPSPPTTVVQCLKNHLMLVGICDSGVPSYLPTITSAPYVVQLPPPTASALVQKGFATITITAPPEYPSASLFYILDGSFPEPYTGQFPFNTPGKHTIGVYASMAGFFDSTVNTIVFTI